MKIFRKIIKYICPAVVIGSILVSSVSADYYLAGTGLGEQKISKTFEVTGLISNFDDVGEVSSPSDLFMDKYDNLYLLDSGNGRILVYNSERKIDRVISGTFGKDNLPMNKPEGLFVDEIGDIYVADTQNARILHLDKDGNFVEEFFEPTAPTYDRTYQFKPSKVAIDSFGRLYITNSNDYHGIILMDGNNEFLGYIASTKIIITPIDKLIRTFASEAQQAQLAREVPAYFSNFLIKDSFIYAVSYWSDSAQIRKLTPAGGNIYPALVFGEKNESTQFNYKAAFTDIAVDDNEIVYAADYVTGKIYVYDREGNNLAVFGDSGSYTGTFDSISSLVVNSKGELFVLDRVTGIVQIFTPTEIMKNIISATSLYYEGFYEEAREPWEKVLKLDTTNSLANVGLAKSSYREKKYEEAMELYEKSLDKTGYSDAFYYYRLDFFREYFVYIMIGLFLLVVLGIVGLMKLKRYADAVSDENVAPGRKIGIKGHLKIGLLTFFHPIDGFYNIKRNRKKLSFITPLILFIAVVAVQISYIYLVHFPLTDVKLKYSDLWQQTGVFILPLISFMIVGHIIISLSDGKQTFKEMITATLYSFLPYILFNLPLAALSHIMCAKEAGLYNVLSAGLWIWSLGLLLLSVKTMNEYSFGRLVWTVIKVIFAIVCSWMIIALLYIVVYQSVSLVVGIYEEFTINFYR